MDAKFVTVPVNVEDPKILSRFLVELVDKLNSNILVSYPILYGEGGPPSIVGEASVALNEFLELAAKLDTLSGTIKNYITGTLETQVLQNAEDVAVVAQQFGTFYDTATAAAWYGLTVKAGELISGFTVGTLDTDTTTPGTAGSFFSINADTFTVGRAIEDITDPAELAYVQANNLPYGTMYNAQTGQILPAFLIKWNGTSYDTYFNGKVSFVNVTNAPVTNKTYVQALAPTSGMAKGDFWIDSDDSNKAYVYSGTAWVDAGKYIKAYVQPGKPVGTNVGDIWIDTDDSNKQYLYNGSTWVAVQTGNKTFYQTTAPSSGVISGDIWYDTDDGYKMYRWSGSQWNPVYETVIDGGRIVTNTLHADKITAGTITAGKIKADEIEVSKMAPGHGLLYSYVKYIDIWSSNVANDVWYTVMQGTFVVPADVGLNSTIDVQISANFCNGSGGTNYVIDAQTDIYNQTTSVHYVVGYSNRYWINNSDSYGIGATSYVKRGRGVTKGGDTIYYRLLIICPSGATATYLQDVYLTATISNKTFTTLL